MRCRTWPLTSETLLSVGKGQGLHSPHRGDLEVGLGVMCLAQRLRGEHRVGGILRSELLLGASPAPLEGPA